MGEEKQIELKISFFENEELISSPHIILMESQKGQIEISQNERLLRFDVFAKRINGKIKTDIEISEKIGDRALRKIAHPIMLIENDKKGKMTISSSNEKNIEVHILPALL